MAIEIAALAGTLATRFLLPYAKEGFDRIRDELVEKAGEGVSGGVEKVWEKVKGLFQRGTPREQGRWADFEEHPEDNVNNIQRTLVERLEAEPEVAEELNALVNVPVPSAGGLTLSHMMGNIGVVNAPNSTVYGVQAGLIIGTPPEPPRPARPPSTPGDGEIP